MGVSIAGELARRGCFVAMYDETEFKSNDSKHNLQAQLLEHVKMGLMANTETCKTLMARVRVAETLEDAVANACIVFEAVVDELPLKRRIFRKAVVSRSKAVLTTNTINLSLSAINGPFNDGTVLSVCGCRFLMPVWFVDDVEVCTDGPPNPQLSGALGALGFRVHPFRGQRLMLTDEAKVGYASAQRAAVAQARAQRAHDERERENFGQARPDGEGADGEEEAAVDIGDGEQSCAVCLDAPRGALVKPCGHTSTCLECAKKLQPPICVTCREPIVQIVPWRDL